MNHSNVGWRWCILLLSQNMLSYALSLVGHLSRLGWLLDCWGLGRGWLKVKTDGPKLKLVNKYYVFTVCT